MCELVRVFVLMVLWCSYCMCFFFFKQKTAYEMRISDWSSDVCSSDLLPLPFLGVPQRSSPWERTRAVAQTSRKESLVVPGWSRDRPIALRQERSEERRVGKRVCQYV